MNTEVSLRSVPEQNLLATLPLLSRSKALLELLTSDPENLAEGIHRLIAAAKLTHKYGNLRGLILGFKQVGWQGHSDVLAALEELERHCVEAEHGRAGLGALLGDRMRITIDPLTEPYAREHFEKHHRAMIRLISELEHFANAA